MTDREHEQDRAADADLERRADVASAAGQSGTRRYPRHSAAGPSHAALQPAGRLFVITGGPGSGKTSVIDALAARGFHTSVEAGRSIIREQLDAGGSALPWLNAALFADLMLAHEIRSYRDALAMSQPAFFDRGIPDVAGFLRLMSLPIPPAVTTAARRFRYDRRVFIAPPWQDIFEQDAERRQSFAESVATHDAMVHAYTASGYELLPLPFTAVAERVNYILRVAQRSDTDAGSEALRS